MLWLQSILSCGPFISSRSAVASALRLRCNNGTTSTSGYSSTVRWRWAMIIILPSVQLLNIPLKLSVCFYLMLHSGTVLPDGVVFVELLSYFSAGYSIHFCFSSFSDIIFGLRSILRCPYCVVTLRWTSRLCFLCRPLWKFRLISNLDSISSRTLFPFS